MANFIQSQGGIVATILLVLGLFNIVLTAIKQLCDKLKVQEPSLLQKAADAVSTVLGWLTANTAPIGAAKTVQVSDNSTPPAPPQA